MPISSCWPTIGTCRTIRCRRFTLRTYLGLSRSRLSPLASRETVGAYDRPLSLRTMSTLRPLWPMLLRASKAMPPVIDPSPMTATTRRSSSPLRCRAVARPWA